MSELVQVGVVGPARGLRGEVLVRPTTDIPEQRFTPAARVSLEDGRHLDVVSAREVSQRLCVFFAGVTTREEAEALRGCRLFAPAEHDEDDGYYAHELRGLVARTPAGEELGTVTGMRQGLAQDLLTVATENGEVLVPFVEAVVPAVDLAGGFVLIDPPAGLFGDVDEETV